MNDKRFYVETTFRNGEVSVSKVTRSWCNAVTFINAPKGRSVKSRRMILAS